MWGGQKGKKKIPWVSWETTCSPKGKGDLTIKNLYLFNEVLLAKWRWGLYYKRESLLYDMLESKNGGWKGLVKEKDLKTCHHYGGGIWERCVRVTINKMVWQDDGMKSRGGGICWIHIHGFDYDKSLDKHIDRMIGLYNY